MKNSKQPLASRPSLALGLALAGLLSTSAMAQFAVDKVAGYAINGTASYTQSGTGHTGKPGDSALDLGTGGGTLLQVTDPAFLSALNTATATNALSVSFWAKLYNISSASAFYFWSPSASGTSRGFQAHLPWGNDNIYFDTDGCCDGGSQRINSNGMSAAPGYTDDTWWNSWHHFVFLKNGNDKQVWIDGVLFLEGQNTGPLPSDFTVMEVGSGLLSGVANSLSGQMDDYAVFGSGLSSNNVQALFTGTAPNAIAGVNLLAYWDFNVTKPIFSAVQAGAGATVTPDISAYYVIANGTAAVQPSSIKLEVNGADVTSGATIIPKCVLPLIEGSTAGATILYVSPTLFDAGSTQTVSLIYSDNATPPTVYSNSWPVMIEGYNGYATDLKNGHIGFLEGSAVFTLDAGGHTGKAGDRAVDLTALGAGGAVHVGSAGFLDQGATNNTLSFSVWMKMHSLANSPLAWAHSPSSNSGNRGVGAAPWSDDNIYFDTAGCCDTSLQRVVGAISALPTYVDDSFWKSWHNYVFVYNAGDKQIWVDGMEVIDGSNTDPLPTDFSDLLFGSDGGSTFAQALIDDAAVYATALSPASIASLTNGTLPTALSGEIVLAYWDFNTLSPGPPFVSLASIPAAASTNAAPDVEASIFIVNRNTLVQTNTIKLFLDGTNVTSGATIIATASGATVNYVNPTLFAALTTHTLKVSFSDNATPANAVTNSWSFKIEPYGYYSRDATHSYLSLLLGSTSFTPDGGGHSGATGDRALDLTADGTGGATVLVPTCLNAVNTAAANDTLSVSFWLKEYGIAGASAFWFNSASVGRDFQAHCPWSDDTIYFDTAGCCAGGTQRISQNINTFPGWTTDVFWNNWHHFVFLKNASDKQVYIDGQLFLDGASTSPLTTDIVELWLGNAPGVGGIHGQLDDFAIYGNALSTANITALFAGAAPTTVDSANLLAYWPFNDVGPAFIKSVSPSPNATGISASGPACKVVAVMVDGSTKVTASSIHLSFNGVDVTSKAVLSNPTAGETQIQYAPTQTLTSGSSNWVTLVFTDSATPANVVSNTWSFKAEAYSGITKDLVHGYVGLLRPTGQFSANGGGHTGLPGDYAFDTTVAGGAVHIDDATFLYPAETNNTMSFAFWCKKYDIASGSAFWVNSPSSSGGGRGFQAHVPWSNDNIYFDTSGCCDGSLQRISAGISSLPTYVDDGFWTNWHHYAFVYNAGDKIIYIDGVQFLEGSSTSPLALDFTDMFLGFDVGDSAYMHGLIDDFAAFSTPLTQVSVSLLASQAKLPPALVGEQLLAYWNFNDAPTTPIITISDVGHKLVINYVGTLQSSANAAGPYTDVAGAASPYSPSATSPHMFYRSRE